MAASVIGFEYKIQKTPLLIHCNQYMSVSDVRTVFILRDLGEVLLIRKNQLRAIGILIRIVVVSVLGIAIWNFMNYIRDFIAGEEYSRIDHLIIAIMATILTVALLEFARRTDKISWKELGQTSIRTRTFSFLLGFFLWIIPASIGLVICSMFGWVEITLNTNVNMLLLSILILFITVFLMEALPEELIFRGYIYRYLNILFPHWMTVILQTLLFSLFAFFVGAMYSVEQIQFLPGFAFILGYFRAVSGNVWTSIGFHVAIMTAFQILSPIHNHFDVSELMTLKFFAFILLPSMIGAIVLGFLYPNHKWRNKEPI